jgi:isocitrate/isopropylmalate dehydrogenase
MSPIALSEERIYSIACIPADGIGPEVIDAGVEVLKTLSTSSGTFKLNFEDYDWSSETYKRTGKYIPDGGLESLKKHDAIFFGAVGAPGERLHLIFPRSFSRHLILTLYHCRRSRSYLSVGIKISNMSTFSTIRQCTTNTHLSWH